MITMFSDIFKRLGERSKLLTVTGAYLLALPIGLQWYWGNMSTYVYSYILKFHPPVRSMNSPWLLSLFLIALNLSFFASGVVSNKIGKRWTAAIGIFTFNVGFISSYFVIHYMPALLDLTLGVVVGIGTGIVNSSGLAFTLEWADKDVGFLTSLYMSSLNIGSVLVNEGATYYINPFNAAPDIVRQGSRFFSQNDVVEKVPHIFLYMGIASFFVQIIGFCLVRVKDRNDTDTEMYTTKTEEAPEIPLTVKGKATEQTSLIDQKPQETEAHKDQSSTLYYTPIQVIKSKVFYVLCISFMLVEYPYILMANYYKAFGILRIRDDHFFAFIAAFMVLFSAITRIGFGFLLDKVGVKNSMIGMSAVMSVGCAGFYFSALLGKWVYAVVTVSLASISCSQYSSFMVAMVTIYGARHASSNVGMVLIAGVVLNLIAPVVIEFVLDCLGWYPLFAGGSFLILIELVLIICFLPKV